MKGKTEYDPKASVKATLDELRGYGEDGIIFMLIIMAVVLGPFILLYR